MKERFPTNPASIMDLILENSWKTIFSIQCLCETWLSVDEEKNRVVLSRSLPEGYSILMFRGQPEEVVLVVFSKISIK